MKKLLLLTLASLWAIGAYAQAIEFMPGYFIDNQGKRIDCFIRNADKLISPLQVEYRLSENSETKIAAIEEVQYLEIANTDHVFERHTVNIDKSSESLKELGSTRDPEFLRETLFLRVLLKGKASLYSYKERHAAEKFFIKTEGSPVEQLVYKKYYIDNSTVSENNAFKQQLWVALPCPDFTLDTFEKISYKEAVLRKVFIKYNECASSAYVNYALQKEKGKLSFSLRTGVSIATLEFNNQGTYNTITSTSSMGLAPLLGLDMAYTFPTNRKKWALFSQPTVQHYQDDVDVKAFGRDVVFGVKYTYITLPIGVRHSFYLNNDSKLYMNLAATQDYLINPDKSIETSVSMNSGIEYNNRLNTTAAFGLGYVFKDKYTLEAAYQISRVMANNHYWNVRFTNPVSLQVGYRLK